MKRIVFYVDKKVADSYKSNRKQDIFERVVQAFIKQLGQECVTNVSVAQSILTMDVDCNSSDEQIRNFLYDEAELNRDDYYCTNLSIFNVGNSEQTSVEMGEQATNQRNFQGYVNVINGLRAHLTDRVYGQQHAINEITAELLNASINYSDDATFPLSVMTFIGPRGVGKTLMAYEIASYLNNQSDIEYKIFGRADYEDEQFNKGLVDFVYHNPKCVLVFNDAEEMYNYINAMLREIFNCGAYHDVSFTKAVIIFTSCIGASAYANSFTGNLSNISKKAIVAAMQQDKVEGSNVGYLSPHVIRGMSLGRIVTFNYLEANTLKQIVQAEIDSAFSNFTQKTGIEVSYNKDQLSTSIMYFNDRDYNAQAIKEFLREFVNNELIDIFSQVHPTTHTSLLSSLKSIKYEIVLKKAPQAVARLYEENVQNVLVICDKSQVEFFQNLQVDHVNIVTATNTDEAKLALRKRVDCILIDVLLNTRKMKTLPTNLADYDAEGVDLFNYVTTYYNGVPLYVLSPKSAGYSIDRYVTFLNGIAKDVIVFDVKSPQKFVKQMEQIQCGLELSSDIDYLVREQKRLTYNAKQILNKDCTSVTVQLADLSLQYTPRIVTRKTFVNAQTTIKFADVIGNEHAKSVLKYYAGFLTDRSIVRDSSVVKAPRGLLLYGAPGTGKKMLAKAVVGETNSALIHHNVGDIVSRNHYNAEAYLGEIYNLFKQAKDSSPSVLLLEDIDAVLYDDESVVKSIVNEMYTLNSDEKHPVLLIATTVEDKDDLPETFTKHLDRAIGLFSPNEKEREQFIRRYLANRGITSLSDDIIKNFAIRTYWGGSFAYIENILNFVVQNSHGETITDAMLIDAIDLYDNGEEVSNRLEENVTRTAYHEMGHYLVSYLCGNHPPFVTIVSRGYYGGYTMHDTHEGREDVTKQQYLDSICCSFAGRAAEVIVYGERGINTGISGDLVNATINARRVVGEYGMGNVLYSIRALPNKDIPEQMLQQMDQILHEQYDRAVALLTANRDKLDMLTKELVKKKSLIGFEIEKLLENM